MKLINKVESGIMFIDLECSKKFRSGVTMDMEVQVVTYKHTGINSKHGEPDGRWKIDTVDIIDYVVKVGAKRLKGEAVKEFLNGNKAAGIDYVAKTMTAIEKEIDILGVDELASQAGVILKDDPMVVEAKAQEKENAVLEFSDCIAIKQCITIKQ